MHDAPGAADRPPIAAWQALSLVDYPGSLSCVLFFAGCNFRCPFCHNPELVLPGARRRHTVPWEHVEAQWRERRGFLDAVTLSGGEPTLHDGLPAALHRIRAAGLRVKLDTNGSRPDVVEGLIECGVLDYVAVDVKAPWRRYAELAGVAVDVHRIQRTIEVIGHSHVEYELRTTVAPTLSEQDVKEIAAQLSGARRYVLQTFVPRVGEGLLDPSWSSRPALDGATLHRLWKRIAVRFGDGGVRGAAQPQRVSAEADA